LVTDACAAALRASCKRGTTRTLGVMAEQRTPTRAEWGDLSDLEVKHGYKLFGGKTVDEAMPLFIENPIERSAELRHAPAPVFNYYIFCFTEFLTSPKSEGESDSASCFLRLVLDRMTTDPASLDRIYPKLKAAVDTVAKRQAFYDASADIYGSFVDLQEQIERHRANHDA
jgi:hypothetical protein